MAKSFDPAQSQSVKINAYKALGTPKSGTSLLARRSARRERRYNRAI